MRHKPTDTPPSRNTSFSDSLSPYKLPYFEYIAIMEQVHAINGKTRKKKRLFKAYLKFESNPTAHNALVLAVRLEALEIEACAEIASLCQHLLIK